MPIVKNYHATPAIAQNVARFMTAAEHPIRDSPGWATPEFLALYKKLINDEHAELNAALDDHDLVETADAICDLIWVVMVMSHGLGLPFDKLWREVRDTNFAKIDNNTGMCIKDPETGKILKPEGWKPPNIAGILAAHFDPEDNHPPHPPKMVERQQQMSPDTSSRLLTEGQRDDRV